MSTKKANSERSINMGSTKIIDAGISKIHWSSSNLQLMAIMEALEEKLKTTSPNSIAELLK